MRRHGLGRGIGQRSSGLSGRHRAERGCGLSRGQPGRGDHRRGSRGQPDRDRGAAMPPPRRGSRSMCCAPPPAFRSSASCLPKPGSIRSMPPSPGSPMAATSPIWSKPRISRPETWTAALGLRPARAAGTAPVQGDGLCQPGRGAGHQRKRRAARALSGDAGTGATAGRDVILDISAPRPVVTPFVLRFAIDAEGARFETCTADTLEARNRIIAAASAAGAEGLLTCQIGLGVPSPQWADAVISGIGRWPSLGQDRSPFPMPT
jgi:hypothetical protein